MYNLRKVRSLINLQKKEVREMIALTPFAAIFVEKKMEYPAFSRPYSEEQQRGIFDPRDLPPALCSPTQLHTQGGDTIGDEAH
jgi:hypothetical protein